MSFPTHFPTSLQVTWRAQLVLACLTLPHKYNWNISLSLYMLILMLVYCHDFYSSTDLWGKGGKKQCELSSHLPAIIYPEKGSNASSSIGNRNTSTMTVPAQVFFPLSQMLRCLWHVFPHLHSFALPAGWELLNCSSSTGQWNIRCLGPGPSLQAGFVQHQAQCV